MISSQLLKDQILRLWLHKMLMQSTAIEDMKEAVDFNKAAEKAAKAAGSYRSW